MEARRAKSTDKIREEDAKKDEANAGPPAPRITRWC
jgi:hypothetical protein